MKKLYKFHWDCGRHGDIHGLFVAEEEDVERAVGEIVYFGEALGKHPEIRGELDWDDLEVLSDDQKKIEWLVGLMGTTDISGSNPLDYIRINCAKCGYEICEDGAWSEHQIIDEEYYCKVYNKEDDECHHEVY
jgi:hypothetical protein